MKIKKELKELNTIFVKKDLIQKNILEWLQENYKVLFDSEHSLFDLINSIGNGLDFLISNQCLRIKSSRIKIPLKLSWRSEVLLTGNNEGITDLEYVKIEKIKKNLEIHTNDDYIYKLGIMLAHPDVIQEEFLEWLKLLKEFLKIYKSVSLPKDCDEIILTLSLGSSYNLCMMDSEVSLKCKDSKISLNDLLFEEENESDHDNFTKKEKNKAMRYLIKHSVLFIEALDKMKETKLKMLKGFSIVNDKLKKRNLPIKVIKKLKET